MKHARLENNIVRELIDFDPAGKFHESLVWVQCPDATQIDDEYDGANFAPPVIPPEVLAARAAEAARVAKDATDSQAAREYARLVALKSMSPAEIDAWVDANVNTLAQVKDAIKTLAVGAGILARRI